MTGTGRAITRTPLSEQTPPTILPAIVSGTMSPYLNETKRPMLFHCICRIFNEGCVVFYNAIEAGNKVGSVTWPEEEFLCTGICI